MPRVLNKHYDSIPANATYIGRPTKWGNPFTVEEYGRDEALRLYREYLYSSGLINEVHELRGRDLVCFCHPQPCHGDILVELANSLRDSTCTLCPLHKGANHVCLWGDGPSDAELMIVGEAPGANEDERGVPFVGRAGSLLEDVLDHIGLQREDVYITNVAKCRPPSNRRPSLDEANVCKSAYLATEIRDVHPLMIVSLGNTALTALTGREKISTWRGRLTLDVECEGRTIPVIPTYHPAAILRNPRLKSLFYKDFETIAETLIEYLPRSLRSELEYMGPEARSLAESSLDAYEANPELAQQIPREI